MSRQISRRRFLQGLGTAVAGSLLVACGPEMPTAETTTDVDEDTSPSEDTPASQGEVNALGLVLPPDALPLDQQIVRLAVAAAGAGTAGGAHGHSMESLYNKAYEPGYGGDMLTSLDNDYNVIPIGCESWQQSDDGLYWDFFLRKGLVFSDGTLITAQDWVFTLQRSLGNGYDFGWFYGDIKNAKAVLAGEMPQEDLGIEAIDDYTLRIHTETVTPYLPALGVWFELAPKQAYEVSETWSLEPDNFIASGPWKLVEFDRGVSYKWLLNSEYKGVRRPYYTALDAKTRPAAGLASYMAGETDGYSIGPSTPPYEVAMVNSNPVLRAESHPGPSNVTWYAGFNTLAGKFPPLDNRDVRLAMSKVFDRETIIGDIFRGFSYPAWGILPKGFPNSQPERMKALDPNVFDVEVAKQLLSKAGFPGGEGFPTFEMWLRAPGEQDLSVCQALQAAWKDYLGITVELKVADQPTFTAAVFADKSQPLYWVGYSLDYYDPATFLNVFRDGGRHPHEDPTWTELYALANSEKDATKRFELLGDAEEMLVDSAAYIFLHQPFSISLWPCNKAGEALKPNKDGFQFTGGGAPGCAHAFEGTYWSDPACRAALK